MKIEVFSGRSLLGRKRWYFRVRAGNGKIIAQSEGYSRHVDALGTAHLLANGLHNAEIVDSVVSRAPGDYEDDGWQDQMQGDDGA